MLTIVAEELEHYARDHSSPLPELFAELQEYTQANTDMPQMQVGPLEGNFLKLMVRLRGARRVLEIGTFTGYSTLMMASALPADGELITCELEQKHADIAQSFFDRSPDGHKIRLELGRADETLRRLKGPFDLAFIDADKSGYRGYFDAILPMMSPAGLIVVDNVLWSGKVLEPAADHSDATAAIAAFNDYLRRRTDLQKVMITLRDGMTLIVT
jgi:caffeoyl-CoA O-methyltransferase